MEELNPYISSNLKNITLKTLPVDSTEAWELFFKYKHRNENLGIAYLKPEELHFDGLFFYDSIRTYLNEGINLPYKDLYKYYKENDIFNYQMKGEMFTKLHWLLSDYIDKGSFDNPVGALWNPDLQKFNIHPGGTRQIILENFNTYEKIKTLCFTTNGKEVDFDIIFNSLDELQNYFPDRSITMGLSAAKGSLIPHVHFNENKNVGTVEKYHLKLKKFFDTHTLHANFDLGQWGYRDDSVDKKNVVIYIDPDFIHTNHEAVAILLATLGTYRKFKHIEIKV